MDSLIPALPWLLGLMLFSALWAAERFSARRHRRKVEERLEKLTGGHKPNYGLTWPATRTRPWQRRVK